MKKLGKTIIISLCLLAIALSPVYASQGTVEVVIFNDNQDLYELFFDAFEAKTGITVEPQWYTGNQSYKWQSTITRITGGVAPDVVTATSTEFVSYAADGLIAPLEGFVARDGLSTEGIVPLLVDAMKWKGHLYQMPYGASSQAMVYNSNLFETAGVAPPPKDWNNSKWTWTSFIDTARKLTKKGSDGTVTQWGTVDFGWMNIPYKWGGDYLDKEMRHFTGLDSKVLESWQAMQDLAWRYEVAPKPGMPQAATITSGNVAMSHYASYSLQNLVKSGLPLVYSPWFKVGTNNAVGAVFPMGMALLEEARNKENGWEFVKYATLDPEGNFLWNQAAGALPGLFKAHPRWIDGIKEYQDTNIATIVDLTTEHASLETWRKLTKALDMYMLVDGAYRSVMANEKSPRQAMEEIFDATNDAVQSGKQ